MKTSRAISTISFNTPEFLKLKLTELTQAKKISFWFFINHKPEDDEAGKKYHNHVYIFPSKMLQTDDLKDEFKEFDPKNPEKPLGCISFVFSKFADAYLYFLHDKRYLAMKGQSRKYHYSHDDLITSDDDDLLAQARSIDMLSLSPYSDIQDAQRQGFTFAEYFRRGTIPLQQVMLYQRAWDLLLSNSTERNGKENHPLEIDENTGEVIENE